MAEPAAESWRFRPDIEGLRAIAIVGVILFHAGVPVVSGGFLGVDVFFVLSGFLITGILIDEVRKTGTVSLAAFWARRARRLLPAATLVSLLTLLLSALFDSPFTIRTYAKSAIAFATYWSNMLFAQRRGSYFESALTPDPFLHTWSLAVEEQYYLIFAPLLLALAWMVRARGFAFFRRRLLGISVAVTIGSFVGALALTAARPVLSFYSLPSRAWEFGAGALLAIAASRGVSERSRSHPVLAIGALGALLGSWFIANERMSHPGLITLLPVLSTGVLIYLGGTARTPVSGLLESRPMRVLGRLSYSWYLWHWPLTVYWSRLLPGNPVPVAIGMPIVSLGLAQLTYMAIESRARHSALLGKPRFGLPAAAVMAGLTVGGAAIAIVRVDGILKTPRYASVLEARNSRARIYGNGCHLDITSVSPKICSFGLATSDTTIVLFGDSHAAQWFPALEAIAIARKWRLVTLTKSGCPSVSIPVWVPQLGRGYTECDMWRAAALDSIAGLRPRVVVMANLHWHDVMENGKRIRDAGSPPPSRLWKQGLQATIARLPATTGVVVLQDTPNPHFDVTGCLIEQMPHTERCTFPRNTATAIPLVGVEREIAKADPRVSLGDATDLICDKAVCSTYRDGEALYSDASHLSVRFSASLAQWLQPILDRSLASLSPPAPRRAP